MRIPGTLSGTIRGVMSRPAGIRSGVLFAVFLAGLLFLDSCATAPQAALLPPDSQGIEYLPLAPGALVYVYADVDAARPLLDRFSLGGISGSQSAEILDRTQYAAAAVYPKLSPGGNGGALSPQNVQNVQLVAWGNYPSARAEFSWTDNKHGKQRKSAIGKCDGYSERNGLSVALNAGQAFVAMTALGARPGDVPAAAAAKNLRDSKNPLDPFAPSPGTPGPEGFAEFRRGAALSLWVEEPAVPLNQFLDGLGLPLQIPAEQLLISLHPAPRDEAVQGAASPAAPSADPGPVGYEGHVRIKTPTATQARALVTLLSMARLFAANAAGTAAEARSADGSPPAGPMALIPVLFAYPSVQDGAFLNIRTAPLDAGEIALLFSLFSLYSTQN
jgi:hypothetical protein